MKHKNSKAMFLHNHPGLERKKDIDNKHVIVDIDDWKKAKMFHEMIEALKGISRLRNIILPPALEVKAEHQEEVTAIYQAIKKIESILKDLKA